MIYILPVANYLDKDHQFTTKSQNAQKSFFFPNPKLHLSPIAWKNKKPFNISISISQRSYQADFKNCPSYLN